MSEEELEAFEVTDYDLENEFNINRPTRKITKNQHIYGIWSTESDGEDGGGGSTSRPSFLGGGVARKSYTSGVSFIAGGVQQAGRQGEAAVQEGEAPPQGVDDDEDDDAASSSSSGGGEVVVVKGKGMTRRHAKAQRPAQEGEIAGLRRLGAAHHSTLGQRGGVGHWEKHTKGIGAKLLLQMGFQPGKGLGKDLQGISAPIEAHLRKGRGAIGAYGPEKGQKVAALRVDSEEEESREYSENLSQWRKSGDAAGKRKKVRYVYKSVDEVLEEGKTKRRVCREVSQLSRVKVIDMTGPERRVLSGYHAIAGQQRPTDEWEIRKEKKFENFALPELQHNLNVLVDMCEQDIIENDKRLRYAKDQVVALEQEEESLGKLVLQEGTQQEALETLLAVVESLCGEGLTLEKAAESFKDLKDNHYEAYKVYELGELAVGVVAPLLRERLESTWSPLKHPRATDDTLALLRVWRDLLEWSGRHLAGNEGSDPYHRLVWDAWVPGIRAAINEWNCRDECDVMIEVLEAWMPLVPSWILDSVCDRLVLPKIQLQVECWNPLTDTVPIHAWIHPWLPLLGSRLEIVYPTIRQKLSVALVGWHPSDRSARLMLTPWASAFPRGDMDAFLAKNILPKLQVALQELQINPHQQHLDHWNWVMEWVDLIPVHMMTSLLEKFFFPKWLQILSLWLSHSPNFDEVTNWYMGWKGMLSDPFHAQPQIKEQFHKALEMMNRSVMPPAPAPPTLEPIPPPPYLGPMDAMQQPTAAVRQPPHQTPRFEMVAEAVRTATQIPQGFRDLLQKRCEERGVVFMPLANRWREGKQVYRVGKLQVYLDRNVIFVLQGGLWVPSSLGAVLDLAIV
ncbi:tuftelin-interacting protein 11 [Ischnura elegans]|uniref:tuftelin-interacting protein 11 n=1 Tax=Ischnura elegans TaxID=197161 RepID=UPI001ED88C88|nr:tuftelin-interacting protein 11 [Ischnura elegans]